MFKKIIDNLRNLIRDEKNKEKKENLKETLNYVKQEKKEEQQRQKESRIQTRRFMKTRGYWNKEANIRAESINNLPKEIKWKNFKEYKIENKSNAKTIETFLNRVKERILNVLDIGNKIVFTLTIHLSKMNSLKNWELEEFHFIKAGVKLNDNEEKERIYDSLYDYFLTKIGEEMVKGSGWQIKSIDSLQVKVIPFSSPRGGFYVELPKPLKNSNSVLSFANNDECCMQWALTHKFFPQNTVTKKLKINSFHFNWDKMVYPSSGQDIKQFEKNNSLSVFCYGLEKLKYYTYYRSTVNSDISLLYYDQHFFPIKSENLFHKTIFKSKNCFVCKVCMNNFSSQPLLDLHRKYCQTEYQTRIKYPKKGNIYFSKHSATMFHPISFFLDIESFLTPIDEEAGPKTKRYQKHEFAYLGLYEVNEITGENIYRVFDSPGEFVSFMIKFSDNLYEHCEKKKNEIPKVKKSDFPEVCDYCSLPFDDDAVIHHSHFTGELLGIVHNACNLLLRKNNFIPIFAHNLMKYDEKFILRHFGDLKIIARNMENFISFTSEDGFVDMRFIDSMKFLNCSLEKLVET